MTTEPIAIVPAADLLYLMRFASNEPTRYYLRGVYIEPSGIMVATDGHRMGVLEPECETIQFKQSCLVADSKPLRAMLKSRHDNAQAHIHVDRVELWIGDALEAVTVQKIIDGTFPDWRRVLPQGPFTTIAPASFNASYLPDFPRGKKAQMVTLYQNAGDAKAPYLVRTTEARFTGVLMPMRGTLGANEAGLDQLAGRTTQEECAA